MLSPPVIPVKRRIKRIGPLQLGKILGILYGALGLIFIPFFLLVGALTSQVPPEQRGSMLMMTGSFAIFAPVIYGVLGFVFGVVGAWLYNLVAKWVGGIEVEVE